MKIGKKIIVVLLFIIGIASLLVGSIAYYRIVVSGSIEGNTGNAVFVLRDTEAGESWNNKVISLGQINPGDSGSFDVVMDASGSTVDMYATLSIDRGTGDTELPTNLKFYTTSDHKSELHKYYSFLEKSGTNKEKLTIYWYWNPYIDDIEDAKYINKSFNANINVNAVQISEYAMMKNGNGVTSDSRLYFWKDTYRPYIRTITFGNDLSNLPSSCSGGDDLCWDVSDSYSQKKKVYAYFVDSGLKDSTDTTKSLYNLYIVSEAPIFAPANSSDMFEGFTNLISINFNNNFNTSKVTIMSGMFWNCQNLVSIDLSSFNTLKVPSMNSMFNNCKSLVSLNLSCFNTSNVTDMNGMFSDCSSLTSLDLSNFNTSKVTDMNSMFNNCKSLVSLNLSCFNTSKVTDMFQMFKYCSSLTELDLNSFNTSKVTTMQMMFFRCSSLTNLDLSNFDTSKVTTMSNMFSNCSSLTTLDLSGFNTSNVTNMEMMFYNCKFLGVLNLVSFNTDNVTNMNYMFCGCAKLQTQINITNANLTSYSGMFSGAATDSSAHIIIGYTTDTETIATNMKNTCTSETAKARIELKKID